jgi:hypothetical protein
VDHGSGQLYDRRLGSENTYLGKASYNPAGTSPLKKVEEQHEHVALNHLLKCLGQRLHADAWVSPPSILVKGQVAAGARQ